jgi:hypothetical protein
MFIKGAAVGVGIASDQSGRRKLPHVDSDAAGDLMERPRAWCYGRRNPRRNSQEKKQLIRDHVDHCLETAASEQVGEVSGVVSEFKAICRYL